MSDELFRLRKLVEFQQRAIDTLRKYKTAPDTRAIKLSYGESAIADSGVDDHGAADAGPAMVFKAIKAAFGNRRKTLKNALAAAGLKINTKIARQALSNAGIDPTRRAETLTPAEFVALSNGLQKAMAEIKA